MALILLTIGVGYGLLRSYLHSDGFRKFLSAEVSEAAGVRGEFSRFSWDGLAVDTASFASTGDGMIQSFNADGLHTEVSFSGVRRGVWELKGSRIRRLEASLDTRIETEKQDLPPSPQSQEPEVKRVKKSGWFPNEVELGSLEVQDVSVKAILKNGEASLTGMRVNVSRGGAKNAYRVDVDGGEISLPGKFLKQIDLNRVRLKYQDESVFLTDASATVFDEGRIEATGEWSGKTKEFSLEGTAKGIQAEKLLNESWAKRITGEVSSDFTVDGRTGSPVASGTLMIDQGVLTALPMLDALAAYADTRRFRVLALNEARTDWQWKKDELVLSNLVFSSEGLMRIEGRLVIRDQGIDGVFRLGLAPGTLASIPGAETDVFLPGESGLLWTVVHLTGTLDDPKEDLTRRLIAAAGMRMFDQIPETGEDVLKFTRSVVDQIPPEKIQDGIEKGVEIIEKSEKAVKEVRGILDGILGK